MTLMSADAELDPRCTSLSAVQEDLCCSQHRLARSRSARRARSLGKRQSPNNQLLHTDLNYSLWPL